MRQHPLVYLAVFLLIPFLIGCLIAPWIYLGLQGLDGHPVFGALAEDRFERVATRCVQISALLLIWPCLKRSGTVARVAPMLRWSRERGRCFMRWFAYGVASMVAVYLVGFAIGMYRFDPLWSGTARMPTGLLKALLSAVVVGLLEEYLFRGFIFGVLRERLQLWGAAIVSSVFFSLVHFLRPRLPAPLETITWTSGFELIPHMFTLFRPVYDWDFALTLFFMGLTLCALLTRHGHLYGIAGLHAGWVGVLQSGMRLVNQEPRRHNFWFGWGDNPAQGALVTLVAFLFAMAAWHLLRMRRRLDSPDRVD